MQRQKQKRPAMHHISRIDSRATHGWFVRIYHQGKTHSKLFSDKKFGGKKVALQEAKAYRDERLAELPAI